MNDEFLLILAAFGVVLWLTVIFTRRRTTQHDNSFTSRTETPHVVPVPPGCTIHTRAENLRRPVFYSPGPATTAVYLDDDTVDVLAQAAAMSVMNGQTITFQQDDQQTFVPQGGDSGGAGASDTWAPADDDQQQQADPEPDPEPESDDQ
jgi:hypothetical protein